MQATGGNAKVIIASEAVWGTAAVPVNNGTNVVNAYGIPFSGEAMGAKTNLEKSTIIRSSRNPTSPAKGSKDVSGNLSSELSPSMGFLLSHAFSDPDSYPLPIGGSAALATAVTGVTAAGATYVPSTGIVTIAGTAMSNLPTAGDFIDVTGLTPNVFNGIFQCIAASATAITYACPGVQNTTTTTGTANVQKITSPNAAPTAITITGAITVARNITSGLTTYTAATSIGAGLSVGDVVRIQGFNTRAFNGHFRVVAITATVLSVYVDGTSSNGTGVTATTPTFSKLVSGGAYRHVFRIGNPLPSGFTLEKQFSDIADGSTVGSNYLYTGCKVSKVSVDIKPSGFVSLQLDVAGKQRTISATKTLNVSYPEMTLPHNPFQGFESSLLINGSAAGVVTGLKFDIDNQLDTSLYLVGGSGFRASLVEGAAAVSGTMDVYFDESVVGNLTTGLLTQAANFTNVALKVKLQHGTSITDLNEGLNNYESIEFYFPEVKLTEADPVIKDSKGIVLSIPFQAFYNASPEGTALQVTLKCSDVGTWNSGSTI